MFKIGKLNELENEELEVSRMCVTEYRKGVETKWETLCFDIDGELEDIPYGFSFALNCKDEKLLELPMDEVVNIKDYILHGETFFSVNKETEKDPEVEIFAMRYTKTSIVFNVKLLSETNKELYGANIEFEIDLNNPVTEKISREVTGWSNK